MQDLINLREQIQEDIISYASTQGFTEAQIDRLCQLIVNNFEGNIITLRTAKD